MFHKDRACDIIFSFPLSCKREYKTRNAQNHAQIIEIISESMATCRRLHILQKVAVSIVNSCHTILQFAAANLAAQLLVSSCTQSSESKKVQRVNPPYFNGTYNLYRLCTKVMTTSFEFDSMTTCLQVHKLKQAAVNIV